MALSTITTRARATTLTRKAGLSLKASPVRMVVARAEPTESSSAEKAPATVYYAGKEYTEEQVRRSRIERAGEGKKEGPAKRQIVFVAGERRGASAWPR